jgi:hypothetical protein
MVETFASTAPPLTETPIAATEKDKAPPFTAIVDNTGASELVQLAPNAFELRLTPGRAVQLIAQNFRLELSNGNGVTGAAKRLGEQLVATGVPKARLTNQKPFRQRLTVIQYRAGYAEVAASLRSRMPNQPRIVKTVLLRPSTDVRVVLGKDLPRYIALPDTPEVTQHASAAKDVGDGAE